MFLWLQSVISCEDTDAEPTNDVSASDPSLVSGPPSSDEVRSPTQDACAAGARHLTVEEHAAAPVNGRGTPLEINALDGCPFSNDYFEGKVLFLHLADSDPTLKRASYDNHFDGKKRRFEIRIQGRFKVDPGEVFISGQLPRTLGLSWTMNVTVRWLLGVASAITAARGIWFAYNLEETTTEEGDVAKPYYAIPIFAANVIVRTPAGELPPEIASPFEETPIEKRTKIVQEFNTADTFTFVLWDMYFDFCQWQLCNLPFGWSGSLASFIGEQPIHLTAYGIGPPHGARAWHGLHFESKKNYLMELVLTSVEGCRAAKDGETVAVPSAASKQVLGRPSCSPCCWPWCTTTR